MGRLQAAMARGIKTLWHGGGKEFVFHGGHHGSCSLTGTLIGDYCKW
jgi:hypothetical protein